MLARAEGDARRGGQEIGAILFAMRTVDNRLQALTQAMTRQALSDLSIYSNATEVLDEAARFGSRIVERYLKQHGKAPSGLLLAVAAGLLQAGLPLALAALPEEDRIEASERVPTDMLKRLFGE